MNVWLKSALTEVQLHSRCDAKGFCPPLEVYLGSHADLARPNGLIAAHRFLADHPALGYRHLSEWLQIFHLPVGPSFTLEALAFNSAQRRIVLAFAQILRQSGFSEIRFLTHLQSQPETMCAMGLAPALLKGLTPFAEEGIALYIEQTQIITVNREQVQVYEAWDNSVFRYRTFLHERLPALEVHAVADICHLMNSQHALWALGVSKKTMAEAVIGFLQANRPFGPDHIHLSAGRSYCQGTRWHGCGFDTPEEKTFLQTLLQALQHADYAGSIVIETNESDAVQPVRMHRLYQQVMAILSDASAETTDETRHS